jgi:hypothetical protein
MKKTKENVEKIILNSARPAKRDFSYFEFMQEVTRRQALFLKEQIERKKND